MTPQLLADAYVWGYPLVVMHHTRALHPRDREGSFFVRDRLSTAADRTVVAPNNDTLYSSGWFDLRAGPLTIDIEPMDSPERYWSVMLLDAYTNVSYVCRRLHGSSGAHVQVVYDPATRPSDTARDVVPIATPTVWVLARVLVDGPGDLEGARAAQRSIHVGQDAGEPPARPHRVEGDFFDELRAALEIDPPAPWHPQLSGDVAVLLRGAIPDAMRTEAKRIGEARLRATGVGADRQANGWGTRLRGAEFGDDVTYRAAFAKFSLAGHLPAENRAYTRPFDGSQGAVLRFEPGDEPPVGGFWSLCVYGPDLFFVDNEIDRYSIGDRTQGLRRAADGSLEISIGAERQHDTSNWLPAPAGRCFLAMRAYEGDAGIVDATWFPPELAPAP